MFSVQRKASLQEAMTGDISDTPRREVEEELVEVERRIQVVIGGQEQYQKVIDDREQRLQRTSQEQDEGEEECCVGCGVCLGTVVTHVWEGTCCECTHKIIVVSVCMVPAVSAHTR